MVTVHDLNLGIDAEVCFELPPENPAELTQKDVLDCIYAELAF